MKGTIPLLHEPCQPLVQLRQLLQFWLDKRVYLSKPALRRRDAPLPTGRPTADTTSCVVGRASASSNQNHLWDSLVDGDNKAAEAEGVRAVGGHGIRLKMLQRDVLPQQLQLPANGVGHVNVTRDITWLVAG
jgi:hypothetical protein